MTVFGVGGRPVYRCQWEGCPRIAEHMARRGERTMTTIRLCPAHLARFRDLPDLEAFRVSAQRQDHQGRWVAQHHVPWLLGPEHEAPTWER